ncbi:MotA/TolQ/ExbB proton channel family protein [Vibrio nigripulchritudo]|uniref:MotA/TolQ/ExbB proton channel family protein n=1 Tax=Vibrio nigripulchritudo TaxID=28173 RepID=UPI0005F9CA01|nr:MotA/TolQ/ExbB proton channel family protein [Vibrio nigripulchritudo]KJY80551.1 flagellar motor protein MotA [Vibrio nigripulchritudo]
MKHLFNALAIATLSVTLSVNAEQSLSQIDNTANKVYQAERANSAERVQLTKEQKAALAKKKSQLEKALAALEKENQSLSEQFSENERLLSEKEKQLQIETGSLGELFGVVRQSAKEVKQDYQNSFIPDASEELALIERVISTEALPSLNMLEGFWKAVEYKISASGYISEVKVPFVNGDGSQSKETAVQVGDMALVSKFGHLKWDSQNQFATQYQALPKNSTVASQVTQGSDVLLDPTRGLLLEQYANQPNLWQRIEQGGVVGKIIIALLASGLIIALYRGIVLLIIQAKISSQLKKPDQPGNNPMGRILQAFESDKQQSIDSIELRLLERILDEQHGLERGLSMLKLMAALAPMLGLLGTVTGMIETFQVITQFGNSDPKVMAGGISMALVTTVMGLVAAMPLLLAHNILSSRAEAIKGTLEKQGVSLVAKRAESETLAEAV